LNHEAEKISDKMGYSILILNYDTKIFKIRFFKPSETERANEFYTNIESYRAADRIDAVLARPVIKFK